VGYAYNPVDDTTAITYPGGVAVSRTFDALDRVTGLRDWLGHTTTYGYDPAGNPISETLPNTTSVAWGYDDADRLVGITRTAPLTMPRVYAYTRDGLGQVTGATDSADPTTHGYGYTALNQLRSDTTGITYTASSANDLLAITTTASGAPTTSSLSYNAAHQLTGTQVLAGGVLAHNLTLAYNPDGDRTAVTDTVGGAATSYAYDQADRLVGVTSGGATSSYAYDGTGLRQGKTVNGTASIDTWDVSGGLPALLQENGTRYIDGPDGQPIEQIDGSGNALYYYQDQLGSTRELADGSGRIAATYRYDAYGAPLTRTGSATTPFGYAGQYTDAETGLQYLRARYYDPTTNQFLTRDPLVATTGQPYAYAAADPLNLADPSGLCGGPQGSNWSLERVGSSIGDTVCNIGGGKDTLLGVAGSLAAPPCDILGGGCRLPTGQEALGTLGRATDATGGALGTVAGDIGTALRPGCVPVLQDCRLDTPQEALRTGYGFLVGVYGGLDTLTFGAESNLGQWAGLDNTQLHCMPEYQQGARLTQAATLALGVYGGARSVLGLARRGLGVGGGGGRRDDSRVRWRAGLSRACI